METKPDLEERIHKQLKEQFHNAFNDVVREAIDANDHEYIAKLYKEIRDRLAAMVKPQGKTWNRIHEQLDVSFFEQLLEHKQFTATSLPGLVNTTFDWIGRLQAPVRDSDSAAAKQRVLDSGNTAEEIVPSYLHEVHACLDYMEQDIRELINNREHPLVREMLRRAAAQATSHKGS